jgi:hypothetical protein
VVPVAAGAVDAERVERQAAVGGEAHPHEVLVVGDRLAGEDLVGVLPGLDAARLVDREQECAEHGRAERGAGGEQRDDGRGPDRERAVAGELDDRPQDERDDRGMDGGVRQRDAEARELRRAHGDPLRRPRAGHDVRRAEGPAEQQRGDEEAPTACRAPEEAAEVILGRAGEEPAGAAVERAEHREPEHRVQHAEQSRERRVEQRELEDAVAQAPGVPRPRIDLLADVGHRLRRGVVQRAQVQLVVERVRAGQVRAAAARRQARRLVLGARAAGLVAGVVVDVAGDREHEPPAAPAHDALLEVRQVAPRCRLDAPGERLDPRGLGGHEDDLVAGLHRPRAEVLELPVVEVRVELDVDGPDPPVVRQLHREVAAPLARHPVADAALGGAEHAQEADEAVVPVVVAGQRVQLGLVGRVGFRQRGRERADEAVLVGDRVGERVDLVAAEQQHLAAGQRLALVVEVVLGEQPGHRVRRVPAVAGVAEVVDPQLVGIGVVQPVLRRVLDLALVGELAERARDDDLDAGLREQGRAQPADGLPAHEAERLALVAQVPRRAPPQLVLQRHGPQANARGGERKATSGQGRSRDRIQQVAHPRPRVGGIGDVRPRRALHAFQLAVGHRPMCSRVRARSSSSAIASPSCSRAIADLPWCRPAT